MPRTSSVSTFAARSFDDVLRPLSSSTTSITFVGGKGGVGKTSTSSAIALAMSDRGLRTLVVSTDPAHSLGDALDTNLSSGKITPIVTEQNLWALELSVDEAMQKFRDAVSGLDAASLSKSLGLPKELVDQFGLEDISGIFTNPPPGIDEIVALTEIFQYAEARDPTTGRPRFDRIVIDTAPTGHTLKLLQLPDFLNSLVGKLIKLRAKIQGAVDAFRSMMSNAGFGSDADSGKGAGGISDALGRLEELQEKMASMKRALTNKDETQFVVVTIATSLAVAESTRLVQSLRGEGISVSGIVCNQVVSDAAAGQYLKTRRTGQQACINSLSRAATDALPNIEITQVPYVDTEVTGIYGLRFFSQLAHQPKPKSAANPIDSRKLTIFGGKGGVGKTTTAASWGVRLSDSGIKTLVVSTDPAHSLGDALREPLSGTPRKLDDALDGSGGELWAMEIDPTAALEDLRDALKASLGAGAGGRNTGSFATGMGLPDLKGELAALLSGGDGDDSSLLSVPGADEVIALAKVVGFLEEGFTRPDGSTVRFDRIVLDTAPTGHTLRMLQLPEFLQDLAEKLRGVRDKAGSLGGGGGDPDAPQVDRIKRFEQQMRRLELLLRDPKQAEFAVVTIPTELAAAESKRLLSSLQDESVSVRRLIINQVLPEQAGDEAERAFLGSLRAGQRRSLGDLQAVAESAQVELKQVPYFDTEVRTVYGLRLISMALFPPQK